MVNLPPPDPDLIEDFDLAPKRSYKPFLLGLFVTIIVFLTSMGGYYLINSSSIKNPPIVLSDATSFQREVKLYSSLKKAILVVVKDIVTTNKDNLDRVKEYQAFLTQDKEIGLAQVVIQATDPLTATTRIVAIEIVMKIDIEDNWQLLGSSITGVLQVINKADAGASDIIKVDAKE